MGIARRIAELYEIKVNALLDSAEDPREVLDYSYVQQQELLRTIHRQLTDVAAAGKRAGMQEAQLRRSADRLHNQAEQAVAAQRDELARQALALRSATLDHADDLRAGQEALHAAEERLAATARRLEAKIEAFRIRKETIKAEYTAAQAATSAGEAFGGIAGETGDVDLAARRAEDTTARLQARADAIDELLTSSRLAHGSGLASDAEIQAQLDAITTQAAVERELARIRERLAAEAGQPPAEPARDRGAAAGTPPEKAAPPRGTG
ncbi:MAG TPA: PspA/IM30 family protein [Streptosporangiaceae bacterium]|nr:PspA/IM30 family protein [Streptosporangiaceae bacterium]